MNNLEKYYATQKNANSDHLAERLALTDKQAGVVLSNAIQDLFIERAKLPFELQQVVDNLIIELRYFD